MDDRNTQDFADAPLYGESDERPPWIEEATDPTWWDLAFGSYGDGYLEWVHNRYYWVPEDPRTVADTRTLWRHRRSYLDSEHLDHLLDAALEQTFPASDPLPLYGMADEAPAAHADATHEGSGRTTPASGRFIKTKRKEESSPWQTSRTTENTEPQQASSR
jgi:hypothetical protein